MDIESEESGRQVAWRRGGQPSLIRVALIIISASERAGPRTTPDLWRQNVGTDLQNGRSVSPPMGTDDGRYVAIVVGK